MRRAFLIGFIVSLGLGVALLLVGDPARWPEPEAPPRQGEAVEIDPAGRVAHSAAALGRLVREPQNTWSNLAFVFGGAWLLMGAASRLARRLGLVLVAVGVGSFLYHASASRTLRHLDVAAMYWLFLLSGAFSLGGLRPRWRDALERHANALAAAGLAAAIALTLARNVRVAGLKPFSLTIATAGAAALLLGTLAVIARRQSTPGAWARCGGIVVVFAAAVACQLGDQPGQWGFAPHGMVQAHALWHGLAAAAFVLTVRMIEQAESAPAHRSR